MDNETVIDEKTRQDIEKVMMENLMLTDFGINFFYPIGASHEEKIKIKKESKEKLLNSTEAFKIACEWWLSYIKKGRKINKRITSRDLKNVGELQDISEGVFICAAIHLGFKYETIPYSCSVNLNVPQKDFEYLLEEKRVFDECECEYDFNE